MTADDILLETEEAMEKGVEYMVHEFASVRTGKASPALVENIDVGAYGTSMKLKQLALISTPEPRLLLIQPFDASVTRDIEKAIKELKAGKIEFKSDKQCGIHVGVGKRSFPSQNLVENASRVIEAVNHSKPVSVKINLIKSLYVTTTMGPGLRITL